MKGLTTKAAKERLEKYGENTIKREEKTSAFRLLLSQFLSPIIILLIFASLISFAVNFVKHEDFFDSILILFIVFAAGIAGFIQDYKAERAVEALQKMATPNAKVIRDGREIKIKATEVVPGDLIVIEGGDVIPADAKIIDGRLEVDESPLTGESKAVKKKPGDKIFSGCGVYAGRVIAKVFATGMNTEVGKIAGKMQEIKTEDTPFQLHMKKFTGKLVLITGLIIVITFIAGFDKYGPLMAGLVAVSLAVAAIPEDLPAVVTIALSLGARDMVKRNALVRRLAITESMGSVDVICTDKTGTLTKGEMEVSELWFLKESSAARDMAIDCCYYCNDSKAIFESREKRWVGDETDVALKRFSKKKVKHLGGRIDEIPFTSERKMMSVICEMENEKIIFSKGAPEVIIGKCSKAANGEKITKLDRKLKNRILNKNRELASKGYRVLALAYKKYEKPVEKNLTFVALVALSDPPRPEVKKAIKDCYSAGIRIMMITGDNPLTAKAIADEIGIKTASVVSGNDIDKMSEAELRETLDKGINIFARTSPFHKLRILEVLQKKKHVVAMTGDGVNDALALKKADVGISMGVKGTEVAKEASDIVLLDDNFATIRDAIKEGRRIFDNIRKFVDYLLTCNVAEVSVVFLTTLFLTLKYPILLPVQILWINLITDGLPALALSIDPARPDVMKRKPRKRAEGIINKKLALLIGGIGIKKSIVILGTFFISLALTNNIDIARTTLFTGFIMYEFVRIGVIRYNEKLASLKDWLANKFLFYSMLLSLILQLILIYTPVSRYFNVIPLGLVEWSILIGGTIIGFALGILIACGVDRATREEY